MFGQLEQNSQALFAGKLSIKLAIGFLSVFERTEDGHRFLHALMICSMPDLPRKIYGCSNSREARGMLMGVRIGDVWKHVPPSEAARPVHKILLLFLFPV